MPVFSQACESRDVAYDSSSDRTSSPLESRLEPSTTHLAGEALHILPESLNLPLGQVVVVRALTATIDAPRFRVQVEVVAQGRVCTGKGQLRELGSGFRLNSCLDS